MILFKQTFKISPLLRQALHEKDTPLRRKLSYVPTERRSFPYDIISIRRTPIRRTTPLYGHFLLSS